MTYAAAIIAVACFAVALDRLGVFAIARRAIDTAGGASRMMRDAHATDDQKEQSVRSASIELFRCFGSITWRSALAVGLSVLPVVLLQLVDFVRVAAVNGVLMSWSGLLLATATVAVVQFARSRL